MFDYPQNYPYYLNEGMFMMPGNFDPYMNMYYNQGFFPKKNPLSINMQNTLRTAQKAIVTMNQIIPVIYQVRPIVHNAKTAFKVIKAVKGMDLDPSFDQEIDQALQQEAQPNSMHFENML